MARACVWTAVIVWLVLSFVPQLALPNLLSGIKGKGRK